MNTREERIQRLINHHAISRQEAEEVVSYVDARELAAEAARKVGGDAEPSER